MNITFVSFKIIRNWLQKIIHQFVNVTSNNLIFQKAPPFKFIWPLKWSCLGHNNMKQAKNPECPAARVDIAVEQCAWSNQRTSLLKSSNYYLIITVQVHPLFLEIASSRNALCPVDKPPAPFCLGTQRLSHYVELSAQRDFSI